MNDAKQNHCDWCKQERDSVRLRPAGDEIVCDFCSVPYAQALSRGDTELARTIRHGGDPIRELRDMMDASLRAIPDANIHLVEPHEVTDELQQILVVPERWEEICLDHFVFGWVAAAAFARHQPLRLTAQGIVFELEQLDDSDLESLGDHIDKEAEKAIRIKEGLVRARAVFDDPPHQQRHPDAYGSRDDEVDGVRRR